MESIIFPVSYISFRQVYQYHNTDKNMPLLAINKQNTLFILRLIRTEWVGARGSLCETMEVMHVALPLAKDTVVMPTEAERVAALVHRLLFWVMEWGWGVACSSAHWVEGREHPGQATSPSQERHSHT